jgi:hypothetical protein
MKGKILMMALRAAVVAGLVSAWLYSMFPFPSLIEQWLHEDILHSSDEGFVIHAWALGPLFFLVNLLAWLPLTFAIVYVTHKRKALVGALAGGILLGGIAAIGWTCWTAVWVPAQCRVLGSGCWDDFHLFFVFLPRFAMGVISVLASYHMLKSLRDNCPASRSKEV